MKNVAIIGLGTVGSGVYEILTEEMHAEYLVKRVVVKDPLKHRALIGYESLLSTQEEVLNDEDIHIIIELITDEAVAFEIAKKTLLNGRTLISGSKKMLAKNLKYLQDTAEENGAVFLYEPAVCGSIPIVMLLKQYFKGNSPQKIRTIANGTSNYILSKLWQTDDTYTAILLQAQNAGFAEADPTDDVGGFDVRSKLAILISSAFHINILPDIIPCFGIQFIDSKAIDFLKSNKLKLKLIGEAALDNEGLKAHIIPEIIDNTDHFYTIEGEQNVVEIENKLSQCQLFQGKGAGKLPTTQAVLADLQAERSRCRNVVARRSLEKLSDQKKYLFYVNINLTEVNTSLQLIKSTADYSVLRSRFDDLQHLNILQNQLFIARISEELYHEYFA